MSLNSNRTTIIIIITIIIPCSRLCSLFFHENLIVLLLKN